MALKKFAFDSIAKIDDGTVMLAVDQAIQRAYLDCADRPEIKKPRKVVLEITLTPEQDKGEFRSALAGFRVKDPTIPPRDVVVRMKPTNKGGAAGLEWNTQAEDNPRQKTIPVGDED